MAPMFLTGDGMRGGPLHHHIAGARFAGERRTLPRYRFYSVRDAYPALWPAGGPGGPDAGGQVLGELYEVPMSRLRDLLASEPPELELSVVALAGPDGEEELAFAMVLRRAEHDRGTHKDITRYGGWRAYRAAR
jgi:gamma-glutamylcyclotransferase (GGCT)/AIG2-like uncharacterized protein YtfP